MRVTDLFRGMGCKYYSLTAVSLLVYWVRPGQLVLVGSELSDKTNLLFVELKLHTFNNYTLGGGAYSTHLLSIHHKSKQYS